VFDKVGGAYLRAQNMSDVPLSDVSYNVINEEAAEHGRATGLGDNHQKAAEQFSFIHVGTMPAHSAQIDTGLLPLRGQRMLYFVQIRAKNGLFHDTVRLMRKPDGKWSMAWEVMKGTKLGEGNIKWTSMQTYQQPDFSDDIFNGLPPNHTPMDAGEDRD
jgi:hypothetical protein